MSDSEESGSEELFDASGDEQEQGTPSTGGNGGPSSAATNAANNAHPLCRDAPLRWALDYELKPPLEHRADYADWEREVRRWVRAREPLAQGELLMFVTSVEQVEDRWVLFGLLAGPDDSLPDARNGRGSVALEVCGVDAYFHADLPRKFEGSWETLQGTMQRALRERQRARARERPAGSPEPAPAEVFFARTRGRSIYGHRTPDGSMLRVRVKPPSLLRDAARWLEDHFEAQGCAARVYETTVPYQLRCAVDRDLRGSQWLRLPRGSWQRLQKDPWDACAPARLRAAPEPAGAAAPPRFSTAHHLCVSASALQPLDCREPQHESHMSLGAEQRTLFFDIEAAADGRFPEAFPEDPKDPGDALIQVSAVVQGGGWGLERPPPYELATSIEAEDGKTLDAHAVIFCLRKTGSVRGAAVWSYETEHELFEALAAFTLLVDPDKIAGYNSSNFDVPFLVDRARKLSAAPSRFCLGRRLRQDVGYRKAVSQSKQSGSREKIHLRGLEGRGHFDIMNQLIRDQKLSSYSLNAVATHFLKLTKADVHHTEIIKLFNKGPRERARLAHYCLLDSGLLAMLVERLMLWVNMAELARVTNTTEEIIHSRGQGIRTTMQLVHNLRGKGIFLPARKREVATESFEGATVITPLVGFYQDATAVLDFASLYPSIIMAYNLCYTTLLGALEAARLKREDPAALARDYNETPTNPPHYFAKTELGKGILPAVVEELLGARKRAKADLKACKNKGDDPLKAAVLDGRQLALKVCANSAYGYTGAQLGDLPCLEISSAVTAYGRAHIEETKNYAEEHFTVANGYPSNARCRYGDTDSVFIGFEPPLDVRAAFEVGQKIETYVNARLPRFMALELEKVLWNLLLEGKKNYAAMLHSSPDGPPDYMDVKGKAFARRDNFALLRNMEKAMLEALLARGDVGAAKDVIAGALRAVRDRTVSVRDLVITKKWTTPFADMKNVQPHTDLVRRLQERAAQPRSGGPQVPVPKLGDRVPYVLRQPAKVMRSKNVKGVPTMAKEEERVYECSEDPMFALAQALPLNTAWYQEQLVETAVRTFKVVEPAADAEEERRRKKGLKMRLLPPSVAEVVERENRALRKQAAGGIALMLGAAQPRCATRGCRAPLGDRAAICEGCSRPDAAGARAHLEREVEEAARASVQAFDALQRQCMDCTGQHYFDIQCATQECPRFYDRFELEKAARDAQDRAERVAFDRVRDAAGAAGPCAARKRVRLEYEA